MSKCKCPNCGTKFKLKAKKLKDKVAEYVEEIVPHMNTCKPVPKAKKFRTDTDIGTFRQALYNCGFAAAADQIIFNDKNTDSRRLKLWFAGDVLNASAARKEQLMEELNALFGDRLLMCGSYNQKCGWRPNRVSYIVRLAL